MVAQKDSKAVAEIVKNQHAGLESCDGDFYYGGVYDAVNNIANQLADYFAAQNPHFSRSQFMRACGLTE